MYSWLDFAIGSILLWGGIDGYIKGLSSTFKKLLILSTAIIIAFALSIPATHYVNEVYEGKEIIKSVFYQQLNPTIEVITLNETSPEHVFNNYLQVSGYSESFVNNVSSSIHLKDEKNFMVAQEVLAGHLGLLLVKSMIVGFFVFTLFNFINVNSELKTKSKIRNSIVKSFSAVLTGVLKSTLSITIIIGILTPLQIFLPPLLANDVSSSYFANNFINMYFRLIQ